MDLICVDGNFSKGQLDFWLENGITYPRKDGFYTLRDAVRHSNGKWGIRLEEIVNPIVIVKHSILGSIAMEPTFSKERFADLQGMPIREEELKDLIKDLVKH